MKTIAIFLFTLLTSTILSSQNLEQKTLLISKESQLKISGDTNINSFTCVFNPQELPEKLSTRFRRNNQTLFFENTSLKLNAKAFDCGSRPINRDFEALIKSEQYPFIFLDLQELCQLKLGLWNKTIQQSIHFVICQKKSSSVLYQKILEPHFDKDDLEITPIVFFTTLLFLMIEMLWSLQKMILGAKTPSHSFFQFIKLLDFFKIL